MRLNRFYFPTLLILIASWIACTALVDFAVVPTLFRNMDNFFEAGEMGILLFTRFNLVEIVIASALVALSWISLFHGNKTSKIIFISSLLLWIIVMLYIYYLTPSITKLTILWKQAEAIGAQGINGIADVQQAHQSQHRLYIWLDSLKLLVLVFLLGFTITKEEKLR